MGSESEEIKSTDSSQLPVEEQPFQPPNGGLRAWLVVFGGFMLQLCAFGYVNASGTFQLYYATEMLPNKSTSQLAWITTLQIFCLFFFAPLTGKLVDSLGARAVIGPFSVLCVFSICMLSLCKEYWQIILAQGMAFGLGTSGTTLPAMIITAQWFSTKRGLATGIAACGSSMGGVIFPIMVSNLMKRYSFGATVRWTALLMGLGLFVANLCCRSPMKPRGFAKKKSTKRNEVGGNRLAWAFFCIGSFLFCWGLFAPLNYLPDMAKWTDMSENLTIYILPIANAASTFGRVIPGWLSDRIGRFNVMCLVASVCGVLIIAVWLPLNYHPSAAGIIVFAILYGFCSGGFISLASPCVVALANNRVEELGLKMGLTCCFMSIGFLTGLPIGAAISDSTSDKSLTGLICFCGASALLGGVFMLATRIRLAGFVLMVKV